MAEVEHVPSPKAEYSLDYWDLGLISQGDSPSFILPISNTGDAKSCPIDIKLLEDGYTTVWPDNCRNVTFEPGEQKTFTFDWPTFSANDDVEIKFQASDPPNITEDNSGITTVNVIYKVSDDSQGTPGFVFLSLLISLFVILLIKKKNN